MELPGLKRRVGRPATGKAKTGAQRQARYEASIQSAKAQLPVLDFSSLLTETPSPFVMAFFAAMSDEQYRRFCSMVDVAGPSGFCPSCRR